MKNGFGPAATLDLQISCSRPRNVCCEDRSCGFVVSIAVSWTAGVMKVHVPKIKRDR